MAEDNGNHGDLLTTSSQPLVNSGKSSKWLFMCLRTVALIRLVGPSLNSELSRILVVYCVQNL